MIERSSYAQHLLYQLLLTELCEGMSEVETEDELQQNKDRVQNKIFWQRKGF